MLIGKHEKTRAVILRSDRVLPTPFGWMKTLAPLLLGSLRCTLMQVSRRSLLCLEFEKSYIQDECPQASFRPMMGKLYHEPPRKLRAR